MKGKYQYHEIPHSRIAYRKMGNAVITSLGMVGIITGCHLLLKRKEKPSDSLLQSDPLILSALYLEKQSVYSTLNNHKMALKCYKMAYKLNPKPAYLFFIASTYQNKLNDMETALEYYNDFLEQLPSKPDSEHRFDKNQITISLRKAAENNIIQIKEELFFEEE